MSTAVLSPPAGARDARPGLGRLTLVELRKMTDTRSGFWLLFATAALTIAVVVISCLVFPDSSSARPAPPSRRRWRSVRSNGSKPKRSGAKRLRSAARKNANAERRVCV